MAEMERVIMTGSTFPAEEVGPNPIDTYRPADLEKSGVRNTADLVFSAAGGGFDENQNVNAGGGTDGTVQLNVRGFQPRQWRRPRKTYSLRIRERRGAGRGGVISTSCIWAVIDHIDILKDGASAVIRIGRLTGVVNFYPDPKFCCIGNRGKLWNTDLG